MLNIPVATWLSSSDVELSRRSRSGSDAGGKLKQLAQYKKGSKSVARDLLGRRKMSLCDMLKQLMECTVEESKNANS